VKVDLIAFTEFTGAALPVPAWQPEWSSSCAELLIEFAGRNCYQSWNNPAGKTNAEYIENILKHGHGSVLEHASATFFITGVSRSLTHELIRHRHLSFSELSQRYVNMEKVEFVCPPFFAGSENTPGVKDNSEEFRDTIINYYQDAVFAGELLEGTRKQIREAARCVMPNCTETKIVVTGNFRAWRGFIDARANEHADREICNLAVEICSQLKERFPAVFGDYTIENGYAYTHWRKV
jgi:thymidylate synthase (FAD)